MDENVKEIEKEIEKWKKEWDLDRLKEIKEEIMETNIFVLGKLGGVHETFLESMRKKK